MVNVYVLFFNSFNRPEHGSTHYNLMLTLCTYRLVTPKLVSSPETSVTPDDNAAFIRVHCFLGSAVAQW